MLGKLRVGWPETHFGVTVDGVAGDLVTTAFKPRMSRHYCKLFKWCGWSSWYFSAFPFFHLPNMYRKGCLQYHLFTHMLSSSSSMDTFLSFPVGAERNSCLLYQYITWPGLHLRSRTLRFSGRASSHYNIPKLVSLIICLIIERCPSSNQARRSWSQERLRTLVLLQWRRISESSASVTVSRKDIRLMEPVTTHTRPRWRSSSKLLEVLFKLLQRASQVNKPLMVLDGEWREDVGFHATQ